MKTAEEARKAALDAGFVGEPTTEVLRQFGWRPSDDAQNILNAELNAPFRTREQVRDDIALLIEEAKKNNMPTQIFGMMTKVLGAASKFI